MVSLGALILGLLCLGAILFLVVIAVVLWLQNRQEERGYDFPDDAAQRRSTAAVAYRSQADPKLDESVRALVTKGRKIEAIKLYREAAGVSLKEAKETVEDIASGALPGGAGPASIQAQSTADWMSQVRALLQAGKKIEAVKLYREMAGVGLKEAKDAVDELERELP